VSDFDPLAGDYGDRVTRVIDLLRDRFGDYFKKYFDDDPGDIASFDLPCVIVSENQDVTSQGSMAQDDIEEQILIKVVFDKKDDYRNDREVSDSPTQRKLRAIVGRRDEGTGLYMDQTIKGAIREFGQLDQSEIANDMTTEYGTQPRDSGLMTIEAHVTFGIQYSVYVR
jgi:hypothetical protein